MGKSEQEGTVPEANKKKGFREIASVAVSTCGVGFLPLAPGTWGSLVGVAIYVAAIAANYSTGIFLLHRGWTGPTIEAALHASNLLLVTAACMVAIKASDVAAEYLGEKDPQVIVVDEVVGQLIVFLFIPFAASWWVIAVGFVLFRFFDIVKPFPINKVQDMPGGLGICADDIVAGIFGGVVLNVLLAVYSAF